MSFPIPDARDRQLWVDTDPLRVAQTRSGHPQSMGDHHGILDRYYAAQDSLEQGKAGGAGLLLGHTKLESTVRYLGIEVDDALEISEQTEVWRFERFGRLAASPRANRPLALMIWSPYQLYRARPIFTDEPHPPKQGTRIAAKLCWQDGMFEA
jgi:hypothetical protein